MFPLGLEMDSHFIPVSNCGGDGVHGHDVMHEGSGDSSRVISYKDILIGNFGHGYVILEGRGIDSKGGGVLISSSVFLGFLNHLLDREPGDGIGFNVMVFKGSFKLGGETCKGPHGDIWTS